MYKYRSLTIHLILTGLLIVFGSELLLARYTFKVVQDSTLDSGVVYKKIQMGSNWRKHHVHVIEADVSRSDIGIRVLKADNHISGIDKLHNMVTCHDSLSKDDVLAAINANFWSAYNNYPISPTIKNGEIIKLNNYKQWSSAFFDIDDRLFIEFFQIEPTMIWQEKKFKIGNVNYRKDSIGIILYNKYAGDMIPYISENRLHKKLEEYLADTSFRDVTDIEFDTTEFLREIEMNERSQLMESKLHKIKLQYLRQPLINRDIPCIVSHSDTGICKMPDWGAIISYGQDIPYDYIPSVGDTVILRFKTNTHDSIYFRSAVSGTPRLVESGRADHQARKEGSSSRRFIRYHLPRTAIGTNKDKTKVIFAVVESSSRKNRRRGASLQEMAVIMKKLDCYDAINLDGGGSSQMIINGENILSYMGPKSGRKISTGLSIIKIKPLKNIFKVKPKIKVNREDTSP